MVQQTVQYPYVYHGLLVSIKDEQIVDTCNSLYSSQGHYAEWKKPISKGQTTYDFIYITLLKWQNYRNGK